jgi:hypothetical protein
MLWNRARMALQPFPRIPVLAVSGSFRFRIASSSTCTSRRNDWRIAFSALFLAYAWFEIPSGWLGEKLRPRKVVIRIVLSSIVFTALTGAGQAGALGWKPSLYYNAAMLFLTSLSWCS